MRLLLSVQLAVSLAESDTSRLGKHFYSCVTICHIADIDKDRIRGKIAWSLPNPNKCWGTIALSWDNPKLVWETTPQ